MPASTIKEADARAIARAIERTLRRHRLTGCEREDLAQFAWVRLLECLGERRSATPITAFAVGIARNLAREHCLSQGRRRRLERHYAADLEALGRSGEPMGQATVLELRQLVARLDQARLGLGARERWLVDARLLEEASYAELLPRFWHRFGRSVRTPEGLRTAFFQARQRLDAELALARTLACARPSEGDLRGPAL